MDGMSNIAIFYFIAQIVERILELIDWIISWFVPIKKDGDEKAIKKQSAKMIVMWFLAVAIAFAFVYWLDLCLMMRLQIKVEPFIDKFFTALAIGSGTKPIHDVISLMGRSGKK